MPQRLSRPHASHPALAILDRDGVINADSDRYIKSPDEWQLLPGSAQAIARLNHAGWRVAVATNQAGLARGLFDFDTLCAMHQKMHSALATVGAQVDVIAFCPHGPNDGCRCRKPAPGLFEVIGERFGQSLHGVPAIGDSARDLAAARAVGARPLLVRTGKGVATLTTMADDPLLRDVPCFDDLAAAVGFLLEETRSPC